jgi:phytoene dehydrogenase-like protein
MEAPPPDIDRPATADLFLLLKAGRAFRRLGRTDAYRLLRWLPMPVYDFTGEWFESEPLRATIAADGLLGTFLGPRSAGSTATLLVHGAGEGRAIAPGWSVRGGPGALADALAASARKAGAQIRTGATVRSITVRDGTAVGVVLSNGDEVTARRVISSLDPRRTMLTLVDPLHLGPEFASRVRSIRMRGALAKVNFALSGFPVFAALANRNQDEQRVALSACVRLSPHIDVLERAFDAAKYKRCPEEPWIELTIPSIDDDTLAPAGSHVASAYVQFVPYELERGAWDQERDTLGEIVTRTISRYAPGFEKLVLARQVLTPTDLEREVGLTGGQIYHGEIALDQLFVARPFLGWPGYGTTIRGLFLCGSGVHPGTGLDGRSGWLAARAVLEATV